MVDQKPIAAQAMVILNGQNGVPFSTVEHDDGSIDIILGFDKEKFEITLSKKNFLK